jgi:hypothetical protein
MTLYKSLFVEMPIKHSLYDVEVNPREKAKLIISDYLERAFYWDENEDDVSDEERKAVNDELAKLVDKIELKLRVGNLNNKVKRKAGK